MRDWQDVVKSAPRGCQDPCQQPQPQFNLEAVKEYTGVKISESLTSAENIFFSNK